MNNLIANYISPTVIARMIVDVENLLALDPFDQDAQDFCAELIDILVSLWADGKCGSKLLAATRRQYGRQAV